MAIGKAQEPPPMRDLSTTTATAGEATIGPDPARRRRLPIIDPGSLLV
jgi:hypothetical protein